MTISKFPFLLGSFALAGALSPLHANINLVMDSGFGTDEPALNLQSDGETILDGSFTFVLGAFIGDFDPRSEPLETWADNFVVHCASPYITANAFREEPNPDAFPFFPENRFARVRALTSNDPPFNIGNAGYIWGFNIDPTTGKTSEWILMNQAGWMWPNFTASPGGSVGYFSVVDSEGAFPPGEKVFALLGNVRTSGIQSEALMHTAAVADHPTPRISYDQWRIAFFNPRIASQTPNNDLPEEDQDGDGQTNYEEFLLGTNPVVADAGTATGFSLTSVPSPSGNLVEVSITRSPLARIRYTLEESTTLDVGDWDDFSNTGDIIVSTRNKLTLRTTFPVASQPQQFFRLRTDTEPDQ